MDQGATGGLERMARHPLESISERLGPRVEQVTETVGGPARRRAIVLLASILALDAADQGAIGAVAPDLERSLSISNVELGLLVTVTAVVGGIFTIPMGSLVDRVNRVRLAALVILGWGVAQAVSGLAVSYPMLIVTRLALSAVTALAAPAVASLTGDLFPPEERGRIYGLVITGELVGAGFGVLVSGLVAGWFGWRPAIALLALPSVALSWFLWRRLPEPARGGYSWIERGDEEITAADEVDVEAEPPAVAARRAPAGRGEVSVHEAVASAGVEAEPEIVVSEDPSDWSLRHAVRYVLSVRTNVIMIISSSVGYFFFAGLKVFAVLFVRGQYDVSQALATVLVVVVGAGAVAGVILAGRTSDRMIGRGRITARLDAGVVGYCAAGLLLLPALLTRNLALAVPFIFVAGAAVAAPNSTLDAARLDVVPSQLWGRAEAVRTVVRTFLEAAAPLAFGVISEFFGANRGGLGVAASGAKSPAGSPAQVTGLDDAFLVMLVPLVASGLILLLGRRSYPVDVASAARSQREVADHVGSEGDARAKSEAAGPAGAA
ncbi:MAG TPA: MFS transporter [Acidimicrobiales bacterium]|nr:MFS transporter [Acidimicrobiales bacterium]